MPGIAVLIPCRNEERTVGAVVRDFKTVLPGCSIYVYDNGSTDATVRRALAAGAHVRTEAQAGKGNVVRRMFADVDADVYVLVDGDDTYDPLSAPAMIEMLCRDKLDMVVGARHLVAPGPVYRPGHHLGNSLLTGAAARIFGRGFMDMLSGYRVFSRRFVKSFPGSSRGFEIETEMTVHALQMRLPAAEFPTPYAARPAGSHSKLNTYRDGVRILASILLLFKEVKPLAFFGLAGALLAAAALALAAPIVTTYLETGLVPRFPTAILATSLMLLAFLSFSSGLILDNVSHGRMENKRLHYLTCAPPAGGAAIRAAGSRGLVNEMDLAAPGPAPAPRRRFSVSA